MVVMVKLLKYLLLIVCVAINAHTQGSLKQLFGTTDTQINATIKKLVDSKMPVRVAINDYFHQKEQELLQKIKIKYGISNALWNSEHQYTHNLVHNDPLYSPTAMIMHNPDDHPFIVEARELIAYYGMSPNNVLIHDSQKTPLAQIITVVSDDGCPIHTLELNISELQTFNDSERMLILKHEMRHLWYADVLYSKIIDAFIAHNRLDPLYVEYSKNQEMRADVMAATDSVADAYAYYFWLLHMPDYTDDALHPTRAERLEAATYLYIYLNIEKKYLIGA